jgi:dihydroneopterin aldolase
MSDKISQAFGHPLERALAIAGDQPRDRISLRDYVTEVDIGAFQKERGQIQRLRFNVVVEVAPVRAPIDDDVDRILSYDRVTEAIEAALSEERLNLLETLAERVATQVLAEPQAERIFVRIEKLDRGPFALGVEIMRSSEKAQPLTLVETHAPALSPRIICLSYGAITHPDLVGAISDLAVDDAPVILCCEAAPLDLPQSDAALAQRRIMLLALEQAAWVLAGRDARCVVVNSRTELDWAMKQGQISVWAPSKIVLDAVDGPAAGSDALDLATWFARLVEAIALHRMDETLTLQQVAL